MSNQSVDQNGLIIKTDKLSYMQGDLVKGVVQLYLTKPIQQGKILFEIKGKEKTSWKEKQGKRLNDYSSKQIFYSRKAIVHQFQEQIQEGLYNFPFEVQLSPSLPGSIDCNKSFFASITYQIKARFISFFDTMSDMKQKQNIILRELKKLQLQPQIMQQSSKIYTWYCLNQGVSSIWAKTQKNIFYPGETVKVYFDIDNSICNVDIENIEISLINKIEIKSDNGFSKIFIQENNVKTIEGLEKRQKILPNQQRECEILIKSLNEQEESLNPSVNGRYVRSTYFIKFQPNYSSLICCSGTEQTPTLYIPIILIVNQDSNEEELLIKANMIKQYETLRITDSNFQNSIQNVQINHMLKPMMN